MTREQDRAGDAAAGLCATCGYASVQGSARGSRFWRCQRALRDPAFTRYPPLPVDRCAGYERGEPDRRD